MVAFFSALKVTLADLPSAVVAVIVTFPAFFTDTFPLLLTVAIFLSEVVHVTFPFCVSTVDGVTTAFKV